MTPEQAGKWVESKVVVMREDIARAKAWIIQAESGNVSSMADQWLREHKLSEVRQVNTDAENCEEILSLVARTYSVRLAFYHAVWELISSGVIVSSEGPTLWKPALESKTEHYGCAVPIRCLDLPYPSRIARLRCNGGPADADIFLKGIDCTTVHPGILEGVDQALTCYRRGLYMPATVMLAAAVEAAWMECGSAVRKHPCGNQLKVLDDPFASIARLVSEVKRALEQKIAKPLLEKASQSIHQVTDAEVWTTALRDRRNALHWGKAQSFIAEHAETGTLLMAAPQHIKTLEAIRGAC